MRSDSSAQQLFVVLFLAISTVALPSDAVPSFTFFHEFYGSGGYHDPQAKLNSQDGMMNGLTIWPPAEAGAARVLEGNGGLILRLPGASGPAGVPAETIENQVTAFAALSPLVSGSGLYWNLLPEWDQSGGDWVPNGRPTYTGFSRQAAYRRFSDHYEATHPGLAKYLHREALERRPYQLAATTDHSANVFFAYELGISLQLLERGIDELGDLSTGIAFLRGAAGQYGKPWGVDISTWRSTNNGATSYDSNGRLRSGWSASYLERIYYLAFAAGAQVIHNEAATYRYPDGTLNPFGQATRRFADFALRRHTDVGRPTVNIAILTDHFSGFEPRHGTYNQANAVWYQDIPYSAGDHMTDNFLRLAYPGHELHGLAPGAPFANSKAEASPAAFERFLALGGDPRPYEPMPTTRWGDNIDVLTTLASAECLAKYKVVILMGNVGIDGPLRIDLSDWVARGGVLVIGAAQSTPADEELMGVQVLSRLPRTGSRSRWAGAEQSQAEATFAYLSVRPNSATVEAVSDSGEPLITKRTLGRGEVFVVTPLYLQSNDQDRLLVIGGQLIDRLAARFEPARVTGPPIEYVVGRPPGKLVFTLANHLGTIWQGQLRAPGTGGALRAMDYLADQEMGFQMLDGEVSVPVKVPPYGVQVIAIEYVDNSRSPR